MAAIRKNLINENRVRLEEVCPLDMPFSISVDPCNLCNFKCEFCAIQSSGKTLNFKNQRMEMELFVKFISDIKNTQKKLKMLRFAANGEPFLNPHLVEMIAYAKEMEVTEYMETVTNGSCFHPMLNERLVNSGIDRIRISVEAINAEGYLKLAHHKLDFEKYIENIADLYQRSRNKCEIYIKTVDAAVDTKEKEVQFYALFENICDQICVDNIIPLWSDFEELSQRFDIKHTGLHNQSVKKLNVCPYSLYSCVISPDGDVTACCADWERKFVIGNIQREDFWDIWNGSRMREFWIQQLEGRRFENELCSRCLLPEYDCVDDIDEVADTILDKIYKSNIRQS